jgi:hypothetical protein
MISIRPITSRLASRLLGRSLGDSAERTIELAPATSYRVDPPIMIPGEAERIKAHHSDSVPAFNFERLTMREFVQGPTRIHLLRDVVIADGTLLARGAFDRIAPARKRFLLQGELEHIEEAALCSTFLTQKYFGHWLREGIALEELSADLDLPAVVVDRTPWLHEASYRNVLGLNPHRTAHARCDRLWVAEDRRYNLYFLERYNRARRRVRAHAGDPSRVTGRFFISRGNLGDGRHLANEEALRRALGSHGFTPLDPERMDASGIVRALASARLVVSPEGSALAHAEIAMPRGAGLIAIIGAQHFNLPHKEIADILGLRFGMTIADPVDADHFSQPIDRLLQTIDLVDAAVDDGVDEPSGRADR